MAMTTIEFHLRRRDGRWQQIAWEDRVRISAASVGAAVDEMDREYPEALGYSLVSARIVERSAEMERAA